MDLIIKGLPLKGDKEEKKVRDWDKSKSGEYLIAF